MCGIAGFSWADKKLIAKMTSALAHRGPDDSGLYVDRYISLGHRRLSIIDTSINGHQPMYNETKNIVVIFNGEIWNYKELKVILEKSGHHFSSSSDTEVIVHGYEEYGEEITKRLDGMFAFAIWDIRKRKLILARDRIGKKPLYYYLDERKLVFASEIKAILVDASIKRSVNMQCLSDYLTLRYSPNEETIFEHIKKVEPGTFLIYQNGRINKKKYWKLPSFTHRFDPDILKTDKLIENSIKKRLISDVPLGVFLSGGLDSSTLVAYMSRIKKNIKTFSVGFGDSTDETFYSRIVAEKFDTEHTEIKLDSDILAYLPSVVWHLDEPLADPAALPTYLLCKEVSKKVKVVLSGEGGDEVFGGYHTFNSIENLNKIKKSVPGFIRRSLISPVFSAVSPFFGYPTKQKLALASEVLSELEDINKSYIKLFYFPFDYSTKKNLFSDSFFLNKISLATPIEDNFLKSTDLRTSTLQYYFSEWLPNDLLMKADKIGMSHGLEIRTPYLDAELIDYFSGLDNKYKHNRLLFRETINSLLPKEILKKKKQGFVLPLSSWFEKKDILDRIMPHLIDLEKRGIFNKECYEEIINNPSEFRNDHRIWLFLNLEIWYKLYLDNIEPGRIKL